MTVHVSGRRPSPRPGPRRRSRRTAALSAVGTAVALTAATALFSPPAAFAAGSDEILSAGAPNPNGTNVSLTDALTGSLETGTTAAFTFTANGNSVTITCTKITFVVKLKTNPKPPGTAEFSITELAFSGCTITGLSGVTVTGISLGSGTTGSGSVSDSPLRVTITALNEAITLHTALGNVICDYGTTSAVASISGVVVNPDSSGTGGSITFASDPVGLISGSSYCGGAGSTGRFSMELGGVFDGTLPVYVN